MWGWSGAVSITCMKLVKSVNAVSGTSWSLYGYHLLKEETWNDWGLSHEWSAETPLFCLASLWDGLDYNNFSLVTDWACSSRCSREWGEVKGNPDPISLPPLIEDGKTDSKVPPKSPLSCFLTHWTELDKQANPRPSHNISWDVSMEGIWTYIYLQRVLISRVITVFQAVGHKSSQDLR